MWSICRKTRLADKTLNVRIILCLDLRCHSVVLRTMTTYEYIIRYILVYIYGNNNYRSILRTLYPVYCSVYVYSVFIFFLGNTINIFVQWPPIEIIKYSREAREYRNKYFRMILTGSTLLECKYKINYLNGSHSYPYFCHCISRG